MSVGQINNTRYHLVFAVLRSNHSVDLASASPGDSNADRAEPIARNGASYRKKCRLGSRSSTHAEEPGGAGTKDVDPAPSVAAEA